MTEEEMRMMQGMVPARYIEGQEVLGEYPGPFAPGGPDPRIPEYNPGALQQSLMQLIQDAKLQYDMLVSQGVLDPRITPFDPMAIIAHGLSLEGSGMPGDMGGAFIPPVPDEQLPFDTNMQLDPLRRRNAY